MFEIGPQILSREDPDAAAILINQFERERIQIESLSKIQQIEPSGDLIRITGLVGKDERRYDESFDQLLVAVGRAPNTDGLNLESVNVDYDNRGITVDDYLRTTNPQILAAGDICSKYKFTHAADFQARIVIQNSLFALGRFGRKKVRDLVIPWATYTSPEIAHVGMYERDARDSGIEIDTFTQSLEHNDRAILDGTNDGFVRVHLKKGTDKLLGATVVAEHAGDLISELTLAMKNKIGLAQIGSTIHPYPTQAESIRKLGDQFNKTKLTPFAAKVLGVLRRWNVGR